VISGYARDGRREIRSQELHRASTFRSTKEENERSDREAKKVEKPHARGAADQTLIGRLAGDQRKKSCASTWRSKHVPLGPGRATPQKMKEDSAAQR